jgi:hypothetical protein
MSMNPRVPSNVALLPSPFATVVAVGGAVSPGVLLFGPHSTVWVIDRPIRVLDVSPDLVKLVFGPVVDFVDRRFDAAELAMLRPFVDEHDWNGLVSEAYEAITVTDDHRQFGEWFGVFDRVDRQVERLCKRYAGQSPRRIAQQLNVSAEFVANLPFRHYRPTGLFSDQSHYIRSCRLLTGMTPSELRNVSEWFYLRGEWFS